MVSSEEDQEEWCVLLGAKINSPKCGNHVPREEGNVAVLLELQEEWFFLSGAEILLLMI